MFSQETKILIVDDMLTMRKLVSKALKDIGFTRLVEAPDGAKAWEILNQIENGIQLVLSDWNMPNCTGLDLLRRVRNDSRLKALPFILLTAESETAQVVEAIKSGVDSYITKPFSADTLKMKLLDVYKKKSV